MSFGFNIIKSFYAGFSHAYGMLTSIVYRMNVFNTASDGTRTISNSGTDGAASNGSINASNHISLAAGQTVDLDVIHDLGAELIDGGYKCIMANR